MRVGSPRCLKEMFQVLADCIELCVADAQLLVCACEVALAAYDSDYFLLKVSAYNRRLADDFRF